MYVLLFNDGDSCSKGGVDFSRLQGLVVESRHMTAAQLNLVACSTNWDVMQLQLGNAGFAKRLGMVLFIERKNHHVGHFHLVVAKEFHAHVCITDKVKAKSFIEPASGAVINAVGANIALSE